MWNFPALTFCLMVGTAGLPHILTRYYTASGSVRRRKVVAGLHPEWGDFSLERIAERLGVDVVARHTAYGDALTAGRIFVALLPELEARRLRTLAELRWFERHAPLR